MESSFLIESSCRGREKGADEVNQSEMQETLRRSTSWEINTTSISHLRAAVPKSGDIKFVIESVSLLMQTRNNLMFGPETNRTPYPTITSLNTVPTVPKEIRHANTRLVEEAEPSQSQASGSRRGSSPARSWVEAAVKGTPCPFTPDLTSAAS